MPNDWRGTPMEVGSTVVYGTTSGRSPVMKEGLIEAMEWKDRIHQHYGKPYWRVGIRRLQYASRWKDVYDGEPTRLSYPIFENITVVPIRGEDAG